VTRESAFALANANGALTDLSVVVRGHDAVHPDRNDCGGVGGCALMRAEVDAERVLLEVLQDLVRAGIRVALVSS
jgi:hypothetical protein